MVTEPSELVAVQVEINSVVMSDDVYNGGNVAIVVRSTRLTDNTRLSYKEPSDFVVVQVEVNCVWISLDSAADSVADSEV